MTIGHIYLYVADLQRAILCWGKILGDGYVVAPIFKNDAIAKFETENGPCITLVDPTKYPGTAPRTIGNSCVITFHTFNLEEVFDAIQFYGFEITEAILTGEYRHFTFKDTEGNYVEFCHSDDA